MWELDVKNKKILVIGAGKSGCAVAFFLSQKEALVTLTDGKSVDKLGASLDSLKKLPVTYILGKDPVIKPGIYDYAVISPGIPLNIPLVKKIKRAKIPLTGEIEIAYQYSKSPILAITGTNGKTTTTSLLGQIFSDAERDWFVGGNIGVPLVTAVENLSEDAVIVAELSSFQLETIESFRPKVAVILNITPDHLDRHKTLKAYREVKTRIFENQRETDYLILNYDDLWVRKLVPRSKGRVIYFSRKIELEKGVFVKNGIITIKTEDEMINVAHTNDIYIKGKHNLENALAATAAAFTLGVSPKSIGLTLENFTGVAHRLEFVRELDGVLYINDSKGTNPDSTIKAIEAYENPLVLIAGGLGKGSDFTKLAKLIKKKVHSLVLVGEATNDIKEAVLTQGFLNIYEAADFPEAVRLGKSLARQGDVVMLSPACASWDMFNNYEERGNLFKKLVNELK